MSPRSPAFVHGDRTERPAKGAINHTLCLIRDTFTLQGLLATGVCLQALLGRFIPTPYVYIPAAILLIVTFAPHLLRAVGVLRQREEVTAMQGKMTAFLGFASPVHAGKPAGAPALTHEKEPVQLALLLIGARCTTPLGAFEPEFMHMGETMEAMIEELKTAPLEDDVGFLGVQSYVPSTHDYCNGTTHCIYWKSYEHIMRWAHQSGGKHYPAWERYRRLQRQNATLASKVGIWHEIFQVSNAEGIYQNMPRMGLGDLWDAVKTPDGRVVYRNSLVTGVGGYATSSGRMGLPARSRQAGAPLGATDSGDDKY